LCKSPPKTLNENKSTERVNQLSSNQHPNQGITERAQADKRNAATMDIAKTAAVTRN
jgi:hypothetical protein